MKLEPDCYECEYRGSVPGTCHSSCHHPALNKAHDDPVLGLLSIFASVGRLPPMQLETKGITVKGNPVGIRGGWFNHPFNFDPIWLVSCTGFKQKE